MESNNLFKEYIINKYLSNSKYKKFNTAVKISFYLDKSSKLNKEI
jgi:hypothetical protein